MFYKLNTNISHFRQSNRKNTIFRGTTKPGQDPDPNDLLKRNIAPWIRSETQCGSEILKDKVNFYVDKKY